MIFYGSLLEGMTAAEAYQAAMGKVGVKPEVMTDRQIVIL